MLTDGPRSLFSIRWRECLFIVIALLASASPSRAQQERSPSNLRVLFIGNSYRDFKKQFHTRWGGRIMKTKLILITVLLSMSLFNCATDNQSPLEGTWKPISSEESWADTTITESAIELSGHAKIINKTHFATLFNGSTIAPRCTILN
jgi:hypothetical protein